MIEEPKDIADAEEDDAFKMGVFPNPDVDESPVMPLGSYGGRVVFGMPEGEIRDEKASDVSKLIKLDIFNCAAGQAFLTNWKDSEDKFQRDLAVIWFIRKCRAAGNWDKSRPQRSLGVWPGEAGSVVLHLGDAIKIYPADTREKVETLGIAAAIRRRSGPIYRRSPPLPPPGVPATAEDGKWVRGTLDMWRFANLDDDELNSADIVAGWIIAGLLGAVAPFRPHVLIYAMPGAGKTTLMRFVGALQSALGVAAIDSFTAAGFRSDLGDKARSVIIDEAESNANPMGEGAVEQALELIRRMATGEGGNRKMGSTGGESVTQTAVGAVLMGAVNPVKLEAADASRIAEAKMLPLTSAVSPGDDPPKLATSAEIEDAIAAARLLSPKLLGRVLANFGRYLDDVAALKASFSRQGKEPRTADLVAALAAGRHLLLSDEALSPDMADEEARFWAPLLAAQDADQGGNNPGQRALAHLFSWPSGQHIQDRVVTLGELVRHAARKSGDDPGHYGKVLLEFGCRVTHRTDETDGKKKPWLVVANQHPTLDKIFDRTKWRDWRRTFEYLDALGLDHRTRKTDPLRFGMVQARGTAIPLDPWLGPADAKAGAQADD